MREGVDRGRSRGEGWEGVSEKGGRGGACGRKTGEWMEG